MKPMLRLGHTALPFHEANSALVRLLLEREGHEVETFAGGPMSRCTDAVRSISWSLPGCRRAMGSTSSHLRPRPKHLACCTNGRIDALAER
jgi:hypothetical protein